MAATLSHLKKKSDVIWRVIAVIILGYILTNSLSIFLVLILQINNSINTLDAIVAVSLASFALYSIIIMWIFHTSSIKKIWLSLFLTVIASSLLSWALYSMDNSI